MGIPIFKKQSVRKAYYKHTPRQSQYTSNCFFTLILLIYILPLFTTCIATLLGLYLLLTVRTNIKTFDLTSASSNASQAYQILSVASSASDIFLLVSTLIGHAEFSVISHNIHMVQKIAHLSRESLAVAKDVQDMTQVNTTISNEDIKTLTQNVKQTILLLRSIQIDTSFPVQIRNTITQLRTLITVLDKNTDSLPDMLGMDRQKNYLILFQNNMELRPGGGFIGSYAIVSIDKAKISNIAFYDIYDADGQLNQHIEPPYPLRRYIPQIHWYMRDSNFDVDFEKSAQQAIQFLHIEMGQHVDGVIGIDTSFLKNLMQAAGTLHVSGYNKTLTADNFYLVTETIVEKNYFPGSIKKKDFLLSVYNTYKNQLAEHRIDPIAFLRAINDSIAQKHILFYFTDQRIQQKFTENGWSSSLEGRRENDSSHLYDYIGINEANIGSNKANFMLKRNVKHDITIADNGQIREKIQITYKNEGKEWPGGDYTNYLRLIVPDQAQLEGISFDGIPQKITPAITDFLIYESKNFVKPNGLEVEHTREGGKSIYGFLIHVPIQSSKIVDIQFALRSGILLAKHDIVYDLFYLKQPGTDSYPYELHIVYPNNFSVATKPNDVNDTSHILTFEKNITGDFDLQIRFKKK